MAAAGKNAKQAREQRERARAYEARARLNARQVRRRRRDNIGGGVAGGILLIVILVAQMLYFTAGPGRPAPHPSPTTAVTTPAPSATTP